MRVFNPVKNSHFYNISILLLENDLCMSDFVKEIGLSHPAIIKILQQMVEIGILPEPHKEKKQCNRTIYSAWQNTQIFVNIFKRHRKLQKSILLLEKECKLLQGEWM